MFQELGLVTIIGDIMTLSASTGRDRVIVSGVFSDGTEQILLDAVL